MSMARSRSQLRGPLTLMARLSKICSGVSWDSIVGEVAVVRGAEVAVAQFGCAAEEEVAPRRVFGAVSQLLQRVGVQRAGAGMVAVGEDRVIEQRCRPTEVTGVECRLGELDNAVDTAHRLDVAGAERLRGMRPQPAGVAVEPAHVALVDRLDVVADRPVVAVGVPGLLQRRWHLKHLGDLRRRCGPG